MWLHLAGNRPVGQRRLQRLGFRLLGLHPHSGTSFVDNLLRAARSINLKW